MRRRRHRVSRALLKVHLPDLADVLRWRHSARAGRHGQQEGCDRPEHYSPGRWGSSSRSATRIAHLIRYPFRKVQGLDLILTVLALDYVPVGPCVSVLSSRLVELGGARSGK